MYPNVWAQVMRWGTNIQRPKWPFFIYKFLLYQEIPVLFFSLFKSVIICLIDEKILVCEFPVWKWNFKIKIKKKLANLSNTGSTWICVLFIEKIRFRTKFLSVNNYEMCGLNKENNNMEFFCCECEMPKKKMDQMVPRVVCTSLRHLRSCILIH